MQAIIRHKFYLLGAFSLAGHTMKTHKSTQGRKYKYVERSLSPQISEKPRMLSMQDCLSIEKDERPSLPSKTPENWEWLTVW